MKSTANSQKLTEKIERGERADSPTSRKRRRERVINDWAHRPKGQTTGNGQKGKIDGERGEVSQPVRVKVPLIRIVQKNLGDREGGEKGEGGKNQKGNEPTIRKHNKAIEWTGT